MSRRALLDVNVLVALFDADHPHHDMAHDWFSDHRHDGWATCPLTENGLIRVLTNPRYGGTVLGVSDMTDRLRAFRASGQHEFWPDAISITESSIIKQGFIRGSSQVTDVYLLALAHRHGGRLVTFDRSIPLAAVPGATGDMLAVVQPAVQPLSGLEL